MDEVDKFLENQERIIQEDQSALGRFQEQIDQVDVKIQQLKENIKELEKQKKKIKHLRQSEEDKIANKQQFYNQMVWTHNPRPILVPVEEDEYDLRGPDHPNYLYFYFTAKAESQTDVFGRSKYYDELKIMFDEARLKLVDHQFSKLIPKSSDFNVKNFLEEQGYYDEFAKVFYQDNDWRYQLTPSTVRKIMKRLSESNEMEGVIHQYLVENREALIQNLLYQDMDIWLYGDWDDDHIAVEYIDLEFLVFVPILDSDLEDSGLSIENIILDRYNDEV